MHYIIKFEFLNDYFYLNNETINQIKLIKIIYTTHIIEKTKTITINLNVDSQIFGMML